MFVDIETASSDYTSFDPFCARATCNITFREKLFLGIANKTMRPNKLVYDKDEAAMTKFVFEMFD